MAEEGTFHKASARGNAGNPLARLEVGIEDDFDNGKNATGFEGAEEFAKGGGLIGNFAEHGDENGPIEALGRELAIAKSRGDERDVRAAASLDLGLRSGEHPRLDIERHNLAGHADTLGQGNRQAARPTAGIEHTHAGAKAERVDDEFGAIGLRERVVEFDQPT